MIYLQGLFISNFFSNNEMEVFEQVFVCSAFESVFSINDFNVQISDLEDYTSANLFFFLSLITSI